MEIVRKIEFCSGHRVYKHESKCAKMHGHNYIAYFTVKQEQDELDSVGRVIDFSVVKDLVKGWIDANWDHKFLVFEEDPLKDVVDDGSIVVLPVNPTAENMAEILMRKATYLLKPHGVYCKGVTLWETSNCYVTVEA